MALGQAERMGRLRGRPRQGGSLWRRAVKAKWCYLFILPNLLLAIGFTLYPTVASWWISFLDWNGFTTDQLWVGLANYREIIADNFFWDAYKRSFTFMFVAVPVQLALSLLIAIILNDRMLRMAPVFRTLFFLPVITTAAIVGIVMSFVFSPFNGPVNMALVDFGGLAEPVDFLGNGDYAMWTVIGVYVWKHVGLTMIYWLAALQVVPAELYEAARVDGAGRWRQFRSVTMPLIAPFALIIMLISVIAALNVFPLIHTMTGGGPFFATEVMEIFIYRTAFGTEDAVSSRLGYASAAGVWFGMTVMFIAFGQGLAVRKWRGMKQQLQAAGGGERA